ncbi:hypothetical protein [Porphyromonas circumdentaria]|uniref:hypothetical protein n=1 Tax=Porphyromonas circumdentaria TaxID=29524 RepID=UPI0026DD0271|nr:hypothetical protein [Porphyromonas circumdentaria]MDO4723110.1 hypothetical protein [Porphyromonas circumdentaria]
MKIFSFVFHQKELLYYYYKGEALLRPNYPFFLPNIKEPYVAYPALALKIGRTGKEVAHRFADRYIQSIGVGFDIIAPNILETKKRDSLPWEEAVAFEYASIADGFLPTTTIPKTFTLHYAQDREHAPLLCSSISEEMVRHTVEKMSLLNIIHIGDILLVRNQEDLPLPLCLEEKVHISLEGYAETNCTLRIK